MKTIKKKVTVTKEIYVADDGKEFEDVTDCESYEMSLLENSIEMYDFKLNKSNLDNCIYIKLPTVESVKMLIDLCLYTGISCKGVNTPGLYMFDNKYGWINISDIFEKLYPDHRFVEVAK